MGADIRVEGIDVLISRLERMGAQSESIKQKALEEGAEVLRAEIASRAPRSNRKGKHMADGIYSNVSGEKAIIGPGEEFYYAHFIEFGFFNKWAKRRIPARPFIGPAFESKKDEAMQKMAAVIRQELGL